MYSESEKIVYRASYCVGFSRRFGGMSFSTGTPHTVNNPDWPKIGWDALFAPTISARMLYQSFSNNQCVEMGFLVTNPQPSQNFIVSIRLPSVPLYWYLYTYPTMVAASQAKKTPSATVTESFGKVWLFNIAPANWMPSTGERVAVIGPLPIPSAKKYFARYMESVEAPTVKGTPVHTHPGPEAWYLLSGAQCLRTPDKTFVIHAGETGFVPGGEPMVLKPAGPEARHSIVLVLHDASLPWRTKTDAWKPQTQCPQ